MHSLALLVFLFAEHDATHWEMSCDEWNEARVVVAHTDPMCFKSKDAKAD